MDMRISLALFWLVLISAATLSAKDILVSDLTANPPVEKTVAGGAAEMVLRDFHGLEWDGTPGARCHHPAYRIMAPARGKAALDVTICFSCWNVRYFVPEKPLSGFKKDSPSAKKLQKTLRALFSKK
jgi:hypothetical protein